MDVTVRAKAPAAVPAAAGREEPAEDRSVVSLADEVADAQGLH